MPSNILYKETMTDFGQVVAQNLGRSSEFFAMVPHDVLARRDVTAGAKLVLGAMGVESRGTGFVAASDDALAHIAGMSRNAVSAARKQLIGAGLIRPSGERNQQVQPYEILHPRYKSVNAPGVEEGPPTDLRRRKEWVECPICHHKRPGLLKAGYCRTCKGDRRIERIAERVCDRKLAS